MDYDVTNVRKQAFAGRASIKNVTITADNIRSIGKGAFKGISPNARIRIIADNKKEFNRVKALVQKSGTDKVKYVHKKG